MMAAVTTGTDLERIARSLGGKPIGSGGWSCRCPAHDDRHNSLSLSVRDGRLLWRCHAGCGQADVQAALEREKLILPARERPAHVNGHRRPVPAPRPDLRVHEGGKAQPREALGKIVATYDYLDVDGTLLFQVVRYEGKQFRQRRPDGRGGWIGSLGRVKPILYRLAEVAAADTVYVAEGEKDVENLRKLGLVATTSPMGASNWRAEYADGLAGKHVVVLPDNDDAGRKYAAAVASSVRDAGARSVKIVGLPRLAEHGDASDWIEAGGDRSKLEELVRETRSWGEEAGGGDPGWKARLIRGDFGPKGNEANVETALLHAPEMVGRLRFDAFRNALEVRDVPWPPNVAGWREWDDTDDTNLAAWCQRADIDIQNRARSSAVAVAVGRRFSYHPAKDYLRSLAWDGAPRIDEWLNALLGVAYKSQPHMDYVRAVGAKWLIGAVARLMRPGCKVDTALILEGPQGVGKSSAARILAGEAWFADQISDLHGKDAAQDLRGKWIIELGELSAMTRSDVERTKAFMSRSTDHYRPTYEKHAKDFPRQCVFIGSTNRDDYLQDDTGNRRFWPVRCGTIDLAHLRRDRDQLWAEAAVRFDAGERWWLDKGVADAAHEEQAERVQVDPWRDIVLDWLGRVAGIEHAIHEVLRGALALKDADMGQKEMNRVARILRLEGWQRAKKRVGHSSTWVYRRPA
jgi:hypothetical protein